MKMKRNFNPVVSAVLIAALSVGVVFNGSMSDSPIVYASDATDSSSNQSPISLQIAGVRTRLDEIKFTKLPEAKIALVNSEKEYQELLQTYNDNYSNYITNVDIVTQKQKEIDEYEVQELDLINEYTRLNSRVRDLTRTLGSLTPRINGMENRKASQGLTEDEEKTLASLKNQYETTKVEIQKTNTLIKAKEVEMNEVATEKGTAISDKDNAQWQVDNTTLVVPTRSAIEAAQKEIDRINQELVTLQIQLNDLYANNIEEQKLNVAKDQARLRVEQNRANLKAGEADEFLKIIDNATSVDEIDKIKSDIVTKVDANLEETRKDASSFLNINKNRLTEEQYKRFEVDINNGLNLAIENQIKKDIENTANTNLEKVRNEALDNLYNNYENFEANQRNKLRNDINSENDFAKLIEIGKNISEIGLARRDAIDTIGALLNLSLEEKETFLDKVRSSETVIGINQVVTDANSADDFIDYKGRGKNIIESLTLRDTNKKTDFMNGIDAAKSKADIDDIIAKAKAEAEYEAISVLRYKNRLIDSIKNNDYLTDEQKKYYSKEVDKYPAKKEHWEKVYAEAMNQAYENMLLKEAKEATQTKLDSTNNLSDEQRNEFQAQIDSSTNTIETYLQIRNDIDNIIASNDDNLAITKNVAIKELSELKYLTVDEKENARSNIENANNKEKVKDAADVAKQINDDNSKIVTEAKNQINNLARINEEKREFIDRIGSARNQAEIEQIVDEARKLDFDRLNQNEARNLEISKQEALGELEKFEDLKEGNLNKYNIYKNEIEKASSIEQLNPIVAIAQAENDKIKLENEKLEEYKNEAKSTINELINLESDRKDRLSSTIDKASSLEEVKAILEGVLEENNKNTQEKLDKEAEKAKKAEDELVLIRKKNEANKILDKNSNYLNPAEVISYRKSINDTSALESVERFIAEIEIQASDNKKIQDERIAESKKQFNVFIELNEKIGDLTENEAVSLRDKLHKANTIADLIKLHGQANELILNNRLFKEADLEKVRTDVLNSAISNKNHITDEDYKNITYRIKAADTIDELNNLSIELFDNILPIMRDEARGLISNIAVLSLREAEEFNTRVDNTNTRIGIDDIVNEAREKGKKNLAQSSIEDAKNRAKDEVRNLKYLDDSQIQEDINGIEAAVNVVEINEILDAARKLNRENSDKEALQKSLTEAKKEIDTLPGLYDNEKDDYKSKLDRAIDRQAVPYIVAAAKSQSNIKVKDSLEEIFGLISLSENEKFNYNKSIENALNANRIDSILLEAKDKNVTNIQDDKDKAKAEIESLTNLDSAAKDDYKSQIDAQTEAGGIPPIVEAAKAADQAIEEAKNETDEALKQAKIDGVAIINDLENLKPEEKADFINKINGAPSVDDVNTIVSEAQTMNSENKNTADADSKSKQLEEAKQNAINQIIGLENVENKQIYIDQITSTTEVGQIQSIVNNAIAENDKNKSNYEAEDKLIDAKNAAVVEISAMKYINTEKGYYLNAVENATSIEQVNSILAEARGLNEKNKPSQPGGSNDNTNPGGGDDNSNSGGGDESNPSQPGGGDNTNTGGGDNSTPGGEDNNIPGGDYTNQPGGGVNTQPGKEDTNQLDGGTSAETGGTENPGTDGNSTSGEGTTPGENTTVTPGTGGDSIPGTDTPVTPGTDNNPTPGENATGGSTGGSIGGSTGGSNGGSTGGSTDNTGGSGSTGGTSTPTETPTPNPTPAVSEKSELEKSKEDAKQTIKDLPALTEAEKGALVEEVVKADSKEAIDKLLTDAKAKDLDKTKDEAKAAIDKLEAISEEDKKVYEQRVDKSKDKEEISKVVDEAKKVDSDKKSNISNSGAENSADGKADAEKDPKEDKGTGGKTDSKDNNAPDGKTPDAEGDVDVADKEGGHSSKPDAETPSKADADEDALGDGDRKDTKTTSQVAPTSEKTKGSSVKKLNPKTGIESLTSVATTLIISVAALGKFRKRKDDK